jgi:hypothetical protein
MARANVELIQALRTTALRLSEGVLYQWTHLGACNCGHLVQTLTKLTPAQIREYAQEKAGEWQEQAIEYCTTSSYPIDHIIETLLNAGLNREDIGHLEKLSCPHVLHRIPIERRITLSYRERVDVILYLETWARWLEEQLPTPLPVYKPKAQKQVA